MITAPTTEIKQQHCVFYRFDPTETKNGRAEQCLKKQTTNFECSFCTDFDMNTWHTGEPTEKGWYVCKMHKLSHLEYCTDFFDGTDWRYFFAIDIVAWQRIEPYKEAST